jgi:hypothetical protein
MDHISVEDLLERTNSLSYNQLVIQSTQRLTSSILKGDCKGLKDFFECDLEPKRTTRSSDQENLEAPTMINIPIVESARSIPYGGIKLLEIMYSLPTISP